MHRQEILSKVYVPENDEFAPFGLEQIQHLCRYLAWDAALSAITSRGGGEWEPHMLFVACTSILARVCPQDVPQGFVCIHLGRKKSYSVRGTQGDAITINLRSGLHFLRNYAMESAGILFSPSQDGTRNTIVLLEVGRSPLRDNARHRSALRPDSTCVVSRFQATFSSS